MIGLNLRRFDAPVFILHTNTFKSVIKQCLKTEIGQRFEIVLEQQAHFFKFLKLCQLCTAYYEASKTCLDVVWNDILFPNRSRYKHTVPPVWMLLFKNDGLMFLKTRVIYPRCRSMLSESAQSGWHEPVAYLATARNPSLMFLLHKCFKVTK